MVNSINIKIQPRFREVFYLVIILFFLILSCKVSWVAAYDYMVAQQIEVVAKKINSI